MGSGSGAASTGGGGTVPFPFMDGPRIGDPTPEEATDGELVPMKLSAIPGEIDVGDAHVSGNLSALDSQ